MCQSIVTAALVQPPSKRAVCISFVALCLFVGCADSDRQSLEGTVILDGQPLEKGQITFVPQAGTGSPTAGAGVVAGQFMVPAAGGPFVGKFRVEITAARPSGKKVPDRTTGKLIDAWEQFVPARYNADSQLTADVKAGVVNRYEFVVSSR